MDVKSWTPEFWLKNESDCLDFLKADYNSLPLLNVNDVQYLPNNSLVRFRGMVQDMFDPEYYMEKYEVINEVSKDMFLKNGKYLDSADCKDNEVIDFESPNNVTGERRTFIAISVPALNTWADNMEIERYKISHYHTPASNHKQIKRPSDANEEMNSETVEMEQTESISTKRQCVENKVKPSSDCIVSKDHFLNFPLSDKIGKACQVKIYQNSDSIKLNEVFEFVGFLSVDPVLTHSFCPDDDIYGSMEVQTHNPPPSLIPRIHCVSWTKLSHNNPLVTEMDTNVQRMQFLRRELHIVLTQLLLGDELAAEYLIYHLISGVYLRKDLMALGKFTLNISNIPVIQLPDYPKELYRFIEMLLPKSHYLPMTLENMNELEFIPKKDYECNRLTSGLLQLSSNTHLVLDETKLSPGKLNESGVRAVAALSDLIKCQKATYDFKYYKMEFDCDIPSLVLSEGKSFLPSDCYVVMNPSEVCIGTFSEIIEAANQFLRPELLNDVRVFLTVARFGKYEIAENVQELVQDEFVKLRATENATVDDLHNLLVLARLTCLSEGKNTLDEECWKRTCELESQRKKRLTK